MSPGTVRVGIVTAPGYTKRIGEGLYYSLPELLKTYVDDTKEWVVESLESPLTGYTEEPDEVLGALLEKKKANEWDIAICLTDLPLFRDKKLIVAEANSSENVALLSLPGLGATPLIKRIRESIMQLLSEMYQGISYEARDEVQRTIGQIDKRRRKKYNSRELVRKRGFDRFSPITRETPDADKMSEVRYTVDSRTRGAMRLITGMVRANRPWMLFAPFIKVLVIAFTTGTFAVVFPTLWKLSNHYNLWRMFMINVVAVSLLVFWIMAAHKMWERKNDHSSNYIRRLYNSTTLMTLMTMVSFYYTLLFICFQLIVFVLLPIDFIAEELNEDMETRSYFFIAWTATSISTIIGALGSTIEDEEVVLSGTYGNRQRQRYELMYEAEQEKKEAAEEKEEAARKKKEAIKEKMGER
ncbi:hypothetical protein [Salimicrobium flavidum]|uniref:5,10-methylene-tetrahydrofolate dehydrogenase n=1 Tax=Salimicrobium flavidum TaxID=570947 RepID=A0A1N7JFH1_9BACI|nr:hypothetical protein [Salimicrobium flavidum]SIS48095.1 hypothetical protein SAMN05421687_105215 [Salimicrobium flavidum]